MKGNVGQLTHITNDDPTVFHYQVKDVLDEHIAKNYETEIHYQTEAFGGTIVYSALIIGRART